MTRVPFCLSSSFESWWLVRPLSTAAGFTSAYALGALNGIDGSSIPIGGALLKASLPAKW